MSRKSVFQKVQQLVPQFAQMCTMADFEEASVAGFQHIYPDVAVTGRWFNYTQAIIKIVYLCLIWCRVVGSRVFSRPEIRAVWTLCRGVNASLVLSTSSMPECVMFPAWRTA